MAANVFEPVPPAADLGKRTLKGLCAEFEVAVEQVVAFLKQRGIDAGPDSTLDAIAEQSGMSPAELFALVSNNL